jgi:proliferating cell nuclear antigen
MLLKLDNPLILSKAIEIISELVNEVRLKINEFGMSITAIDPANVAMVNLKIPKNIFSKFEIEKESLGINLENLKKVLKRSSTGSSLIIEKKDNLLEITIQDKIKRNFKINLIEIETEEIDFNSKLQNMEFSTDVEINSLDFISSIEDCLIVSDACYFKKEDNNFIIGAKSINSTFSEFSGDEAKISGENANSKYSLEYLSKFIKGAKICEKVGIKFATNHPLKINFNSLSLDISFVLAPRVETEY